MRTVGIAAGLLIAALGPALALADPPTSPPGQSAAGGNHGVGQGFLSPGIGGGDGGLGPRISVSAPEPAVLALTAAGLAAAGWLRRRGRR